MLGNRTAVGSRLSATARVISYVLPTGMYASGVARGGGGVRGVRTHPPKFS